MIYWSSVHYTLASPLPPTVLSKVKVRSTRVLFPSGVRVEKELIHLADTTSANLSQIQGRELHNVIVQKTLISIYTNAWQGALPKSLEVIFDLYVGWDILA